MLIAAVVAGAGCRSTYYAAWEKLGKHKRDLLRDNVKAARQDQQAAAEQFQDALTRLKQMYRVEGGELEKQYNRLKADYDACNRRAQTVSTRIRNVEKVAEDLFAEWENEIRTISSAELRGASERNLRATREQYRSLHDAMKRAEKTMQPVLTRFNDHVLYLKHNLNAQAIGALKTEAQDIEREIGRLIEDMNRSVGEANRFLQSWEKP